jgi:hypothetical protein
LKYRQPNAPGDFRRALQELDGSFLRYAMGTANFINPSIREFIASEISGDRDTVEDLVMSSVRFKQITNLSMLTAAQQRESANPSPRMSSTFVFDKLTKLLRSPSLRWEKIQGVRRGYPIDLSATARVKFLMEAARDEESIALANLADKGAEFIVASGKGAVVDFRAVTSLLEAMGENSWYLDHGGRETYRQLLTYLMGGISWAFATDWMSLLAFRPKALEWTSAFEAIFQKEMNAYQEGGASDERLNCSTLDELFDLRDSLRQLSDQYGLEFQSEIEMLDEEIAERRDHEPDEPDDDERLLKSVPTARRDTMSDDEIRQMFSVFREKD